MRHALWMVTFLVLSLASVVSVSAFQTASVSHGATATVVASNNAALSLIRVDTALTRYEGGSLVMELQPQQPDSTYVYERVFRVRNRTAQAKTISIAGVTGETSPGIHLTLTRHNNGLVLWQNGSNGSITTTLAPDAAFAVDITVDVDAGAPVTPTNLTITVDGR
ncbi:MAG TPA: hypothetical protein VD902_18045 [Symbiobacteriaceae bacterium]|nr:hypothetical protein [Symbiobacteriaceae bacterium]